MPYYFLLSHCYYKLNIIITHHQCDYDFPSFNTVTVRGKEPKSVNAFDFIHILSHRFNPIRSQLETVLDFWLVNVCMKECELIKKNKGGHSFRLLVEKFIIIIITEQQ